MQTVIFDTSINVPVSWCKILKYPIQSAEHVSRIPHQLVLQNVGAKIVTSACRNICACTRRKQLRTIHGWMTATKYCKNVL